MKKDENNEFNEKLSKQEEDIKKLNSKLNEKDIILSRTKSYLFDLEYDLNKANNEITFLKKDLVELHTKKEELNEMNLELNEMNLKLNYLKNQSNSQLSRLDKNKYHISCLKEQINDKNTEIQYLKRKSFTKILFSPLSYAYLLFKSKPREIKLNFKLLNALKNSNCFDIGYYLSNNKEVKSSALCKYFSPEVHYVLNGFDEGYKFNKKYFDRSSKKELLNYLYNCVE